MVNIDRDALISRVDAEALYDYFGVGLALEGAQYKAYCPFHGDGPGGRPNLSVDRDGKFHCFVCGVGGSAIDLVALMNRKKGGDTDYERPVEAAEFADALYDLDDILAAIARERPAPAPKPDLGYQGAAGPPGPPDYDKLAADVRRWHAALFPPDSYAAEQVLAFLTQERRLDREVLHALRVGYDIDSGRVTLPVPDGGDRWVNVRKYQPHAAHGVPKVLSYAPGYGSNRRLNPWSSKYGERVIVLAGEMDYLAARSVGFDEADSFTSGEGTVPAPELIADWKAKRVYIWYDNDEAGAKGADKLARRVHEVGGVPFVLRWPDGTPAGGFDLSDLRAAHPDWGRAELEAFLIENAVPYAVVPAKPGRPGKTYMRTDTGNAERFRARQGRELRFNRKLGGWLAWHGERFVADETGAVTPLAVETVRKIVHEEEPLLTDEEEREALRKWAKTSESAPRLEAMLRIAATLPGIAVRTEDFDAPATSYLLNVANGTVELQGGQLREHRREDLITKLAPVAYDPQAACPAWDAFLEEIFQGDAELIRFVQKALGSALTGDTRDQALFILYGTGQNGKSTLIKHVRTVLGDYAVQAAADVFVRKERPSHPTELADLHGARFVAASETDKGIKLAEALVKTVTGGEPLKARFMNRDFFEFAPTFKVFLQTNHRPEIDGGDEGIWRRIRLIPFLYKIPRVDPAIDGRLEREYPGILAWLVRGCLAWQAEGLGAPPAVRDATDAYRAHSDPVAGFLREACDTSDPDGFAGKTEMYAAYQAWALQNDARELGRREFTNRLEEGGLTQHRTPSARGWRGVRLRSPEAPSEGPLLVDQGAS